MPGARHRAAAHSDAVPVRGTAPGQVHGARAGDGAESRGQVRLSDSRLADDHQQLRRALRKHTVERRAQAAELFLASDQRTVVATTNRRHVRLERPEDQAARHRGGLRPVPDQPPRTAVDADLAARGVPGELLRVAYRRANHGCGGVAVRGHHLAGETPACSANERARNSSEARSARRASSSCATGVPNSASRASPCSSATNPPCLAQTTRATS